MNPGALYGLRCPACETHVYSDEQVAWAARELRHRDYEAPAQEKLEKLWNENEVFRADVNSVAEAQRGVSTLQKQYFGEMSTLKKEFNERVRPLLSVLKATKQEFIERARKVPSRGRYLAKFRKIVSAQDRLFGSYQMERWEVHTLNRLRREGRLNSLPKIFMFGYRHGRRVSPKYYFQIVV